MLPHYATSALLPWQPVFDEHVKHLLAVIKQSGSNDRPLDALDMIAHTLLDILAEIILNDNANALSDWANGKQSAVVQAVKNWPRRGAYVCDLWCFVCDGTEVWHSFLDVALT